MACLALIVVLLFLKLIQRLGFIFRALNYLTMPGAIFHELGHYLVCKAYGIRVSHVDWFHWGYMLNRERASVKRIGKWESFDSHAPRTFMSYF